VLASILRLSFAAVLLCALPVSAQVSGRVAGTVIDVSGGAVSGARIQLTLPGGQVAVLTATTTAEGTFRITGVQPGFYDLAVEAPGFQKSSLRGIKVDPAQEAALPQIKLELQAVQQAIEVAADLQTVQTNNAEVSTTVSNEQVRRLPVLDRQVLSLLTTQAGVTDGRGPAVMNGLRTSFTNLTIDGINIQDNLFRDNAVNFTPNRLAIDQVAEITVSTSNTNASVGGGAAAQVNLVTPSGTNQYHGSAYWYNRNSYFAANDWFNNADGVERPRLNQNQFGGSIGGPVKRDKLFFFFNYEGLRLNQQELANRPLLTDDARRGIFTYRDPSGAVRKENVFQLTGSRADSEAQKLIDALPSASLINNNRLGDSRPGYVGNTGGYSFNLRDNETRNNYTSKGDYWLSPAHSFTGTYVRNRAETDRPDIANDFSPIPNAYTNGGADLMSAAWRWSPSATWTNELRGGFNRSFVDFIPRNERPAYLAASATLLFSNPVNTFLPEGRGTNTYMLMDNASHIRGKHTFQMGFQMQRTYTSPYLGAGILPVYSLGISVNNPNGLNSSQLPGATANDVTNANTLLSNVAGYISSFTQDFNITDRTSGFVPNQMEQRNWTLHNYAGYFQDTWKVRRNLTLNLGVRYEYFTRVDERDSLALLPVVTSGSFIDTLRSNATLDFAGSSIGRPMYGKDLNNFAPNVGMSWDVFGNGRTAVRAGYSVNFVNDGHIAGLRNSADTNDGLTATSSRDGLNAVLASRPVPAAPVFQVPRTVRDNFLLNPAASATGMPDPNLRTPYVQQWNFGIQQEWKGTIFEARYVGNHGVKLFRAFDYNQVVIRENGFLDDFNRARNNGFLAQDAGRGFDPSYNPAIAGSQPLPVFDSLGNRGNLANATNRNWLLTNQPAEMAARYFTARTAGSDIFFRNPVSLGTNAMLNYSHSSYNALQVDVRRRTRSGIQFQGNYTFSKVLSDGLGERQVRFDPFLDYNNSAIERARVPFDLRHAIKGNFVYELPFGEGKRFNYKPLSRLLSGWAAGSNLFWQSGTPFSVLSVRGTINRSGIRSNSNTVDTTMTAEQLNEVVGFYMTPDGPFFINPTAKSADGRGVASDGAPAFDGQAFFNPAAGMPGALQRRRFSGPWNFNLDLAVQKITRITERQSLEFRMESFNLTNRPTFFVGDEATTTTRFNVNSTTFGQIIDTLTAPRRFQFGLYYRF